MPCWKHSFVAAILIVSVVVAADSAHGKAARIPQKLDLHTARALTALAVGHGTYTDDLEGGGRPIPAREPFYEFYGVGQVSGSFGYFSVNKWTGDVWALWGCHKLTNPAVLKIQEQIRQRFTARELKQYARLSALKPECIVEVP